MNILVTQTNLYAAQTLEEARRKGPLKRFSRLWQWENKETNDTEMEQFLGLTLLSGLVHKPSLHLYWTTETIFATPVFSSVMSRNRYQLLLRMLHLSDNRKKPADDDPNRDRLYKVRPLITELQQSFQEVYKPGRHLAIDESLFLWKGALVFKQYIPLKRARFGVKIFKLCEDSGYTYRFHIYTGAQDPAFHIDDNIPDDDRHLPMSEKMVVFMMQPLINQGYHLYMDSWYSGLHLYRYMYQHGTSCCGTIKANRLVPVVTDLHVLTKGESKALRCGELLAVKWYSSKIVYLLSTIHANIMKTVVKKKRPNVRKPACVVDYNTKMGAVDKQDQRLEPYDATRRTARWYKKLTIHLLQVALLNAFLLYQKDGHKKSLLRFQSEVIFSMITCGMERPAAVMRAEGLAEDIARLTQRHFPSKVPETEKQGKKTSARCKVCSHKGQRRVSTFCCSECASKPGLCGTLL